MIKITNILNHKEYNYGDYLFPDYGITHDLENSARSNIDWKINTHEVILNDEESKYRRFYFAALICSFLYFIYKVKTEDIKDISAFMVSTAFELSNVILYDPYDKQFFIPNEYFFISEDLTDLDVCKDLVFNEASADEGDFYYLNANKKEAEEFFKKLEEYYSSKEQQFVNSFGKKQVAYTKFTEKELFVELSEAFEKYILTLKIKGLQEAGFIKQLKNICCKLKKEFNL
jgi:hypothetical protein